LPLSLFKKLLAKKTNNSDNATQFIVELNNTMAIRYVGDKATSKISLANMTLISDVNATISGIQELCQKAGIPSIFCKLKQISQTQSHTFGDISGISKIGNASDIKQNTKITETSFKPLSSDTSLAENNKMNNNQGI
jgi:hypothetical protein